MEKEEFNKLSKEEQKKVPFKELPKGNKIGMIVIILIVIALLSTCAKTCMSDEKAEGTTADIKESSVIDTISNITAMQNAFTAVSKFNGDDYRGSIEGITNENALFYEWSILITQCLRSQSKEDIDMAEKLKKKVIAIQTKEFPLMRKAWASISKDKMWEHDIDVSLSSNKIINFSGAVFAANKNIKDAQDKVSDMAISLRFKEVRYRWYKDAGEFQYYKLESKNDSEL